MTSKRDIMKTVQDELDNSNWTFEDVAKAAGLEDEEVEQFDTLMRERFNPDKESKAFHLPYAAEWAARMKLGYAYAAADNQTTAVLKGCGYTEA